jgi:hypothetical protein
MKFGHCRRLGQVDVMSAGRSVARRSNALQRKAAEAWAKKVANVSAGS